MKIDVQFPRPVLRKEKKLWSKSKCLAYLKKMYTKTYIWFINLGPIRLISIKFEISFYILIYVSSFGKIQWICQRKIFMTMKLFEFYTKVISHWRHTFICLEFNVPFPQSTIIRESSQNIRMTSGKYEPYKTVWFEIFKFMAWVIHLIEPPVWRIQVWFRMKICFDRNGRENQSNIRKIWFDITYT